MDRISRRLWRPGVAIFFWIGIFWNLGLASLLLLPFTAFSAFFRLLLLCKDLTQPTHTLARLLSRNLFLFINTNNTIGPTL